MPRDGSGNYTRSDGTRTGTTVWDKNKASAIKITSSEHDLHDQDMADAIDGSVAVDGQTPMTGNLDMGGNKVVNTTPTTGTFTPSFRVLSGGSFTYTSQTGFYTLIEGLCFFNLLIQGTKVSSPILYVEIEGLPFVAGSSHLSNTVTIGETAGVTTSDTLIMGNIQSGTQRIFITSGDGTAANFLDYSTLTSPRFYISGFYEVV